jgi:hypothetical protein
MSVPTDVQPSLLRLWLRPEGRSYSNGAGIATWTDDSGSANHATQSSSAHQPISVDNVLAGYAGAKFPAAGTARMSLASHLGWSFVGPVFTGTVYFVFIKTSGYAMIASEVASGYQWVLNEPSAGSGKFEIYPGGFLSNTLTTANGAGDSLCITMNVAGSARDVFFYEKGAGLGSGASFAAAQLDTLGYFADNAQSDFYLLEVIVWDAVLDSTERATIDAYIADKYFAAPPDAPSSEVLTQIALSTVRVAWTDNSSNEASFRIERKTGSGGTYSEIGSVSAGVTHYDDSTGLSVGPSFYYRVRARNAVGDSAYLTEQSIVLEAAPAAATACTVTKISANTNRITWTDNSSNETGFRIERRVGAGGSWSSLGTVGANVTTFDDTTAAVDVVYYYQVWAFASFADAASSALSAAFQMQPADPTSCAAVNSSSSTMDVTWTDNSSSETSYIVERKVGAGTFALYATLAANTVFFQDTSITIGLTYQYRVKASNSGGDSGYSTSSAVTASPDRPAAPSSCVVTRIATLTNRVSWVDNSSSETGFRIERKTGIGGTWASLGTVTADVTHFDDTTPAIELVYYYQVWATSALGDSFSSALSAAVQMQPADPSSCAAVNISSSTNDVTWLDNSTSETSFVIERRMNGGAWFQIAEPGAGIMYFRDATASASATWTYRVAAKNSGGLSGYSTSSDVVTPAASANNYLFELATNNTGTGVLWRGRGGDFDEVSFAVTSRLITRYLRAINRAGLYSAGYAVATKTVNAPVAPTLSKDTSPQPPNSIRLHVATTTPRQLIKSTVVQIRSTDTPAQSFPSTTAEGTDRQFRFRGAPEEITVDWKAGGGTEIRVSHEDVFTSTLADNAWTTIAHTFTRFLDSDIDPTTSLSRAAMMNTPSMSGGGIITFNVDTTLSWTSSIIISPVDTAFQPDGRVTIAAATSAALANNSILYARQTKGSTSAPTLAVVDAASYAPPQPADTFYDFIIGYRRTDGKFKLYNQSVLDSGQSVVGDTFIPYASIINAMIVDATITSAKIQTLLADKLVASSGDFQIVLADNFGTRNYVQQGAQTAQRERVSFEQSVNGAITGTTATRVYTKTAATSAFDSGVSSSRSSHRGDCSATYTVEYDYTSTSLVELALHNSQTPPATRANADFAMYARGTAYGTRAIVCVEAGSATAYNQTWSIGDTLEIAVESNVVKFYWTSIATGVRTLLATAASAVKRPLALIANIYLQNQSTIESAYSFKGFLAPTVMSKVRWASRVNTSLNGTTDALIGASSGWGTAGSFSLDSIAAATDGAVEFFANQTDKGICCGLSRSNNNDSWDTVEFGVLLAADGTYVVVESGTARTSAAAYTTTNRFRVARENGVLVARKDGAIVWTSGLAPTEALFVDTAFLSTGSLAAPTIASAGAIGQGVQITPTGPAAFNQGVSILDTTLDAVVATSVKATNAQKQYVGNDYGAPQIYKLSAVSIEDEFMLDDAVNEVRVALAVTTPARGTDPIANFDSVYQCRVRVLNQFGEEIATPQPRSFTGGTQTLAHIKHSRLYADPSTQACYVISFRNAFPGYSLEAYFFNGTLTYNPPTFVQRKDAHLALNVGLAEANGASPGGALRPIWVNPLSTNGASQQLETRVVGRSAWLSIALAANAGTALLSLGDGRFAAGALVDMRVKDLTTNAISNVERVRIPYTHLTSPARTAPFTLFAVLSRLARIRYICNGLRLWVRLQRASRFTRMACYSRRRAQASATTQTARR